MNSARIIPIALGLGALLGGLGCGNDTSTNPTPGRATVSLATPNVDDGAVQVTLTGPGLANPLAATSAYRLYFRLASADELRVMVVGDLSAGVLLTVGVGEVNHIGKYAGTVVQAASRTDQLRTTLTGYGLTFAGQ